MSVIHTKDNHVAALEALPGDSVAMTRIGKARAYRSIQHYDEAVQEAVGMADHMRDHIDVVPMELEEFVESKTGMPFIDYMRTLPAAFLEELRQDCINACVEVLRDSNDRDVKAQAAAVLVKLGVVK